MALLGESQSWDFADEEGKTPCGQHLTRPTPTWGEQEAEPGVKAPEVSRWLWGMAVYTTVPHTAAAPRELGTCLIQCALV